VHARVRAKQKIPMQHFWLNNHEIWEPQFENGVSHKPWSCSSKFEKSIVCCEIALLVFVNY